MAPPHATHAPALLPGSSLCAHHGTRRAAGRGGLAHPASRGEEGVRAPPGTWGGGAGRRPYQQQPPPAPSALCSPVSLRLAGLRAAPARGSGGSCYSVPNPVGHRAIYLDVGPPRPDVHPLSPLQEKPHFMPPPHAHLHPGAPSSLRRGSEDAELTAPWYRGLSPATLRGLAPARFPDPLGRVSVEAS